MGDAGPVHESDVHRGDVHRGVRAQPGPMRRQHAADVQRERDVDERGGLLPADLCERHVLGRVLPRGDPVPRKPHPVVHRNRHLANADHVLGVHARLLEQRLVPRKPNFGSIHTLPLARLPRDSPTISIKNVQEAPETS